MPNIIFSEGSGLNDSVYGKSQEPIKFFLEKQAEAFEQASIIDKLLAKTPSTHAEEKYGAMTAMQGFEPVGEGGAYPVDGFQEGFAQRIQNVTWKDSFTITKEMMDDGRVIDLKQKPQAFITGYYRTREVFAHRLFAAALQKKTSFKVKDLTFSSATGDGLCLFHTQHPSKVDSTLKQSNMFADTFSNKALIAAETAMQNFVGDAGNILSVTPDTIVIPNNADLKEAVFAAIGADKDPATANNAFNYNYGRWNVIVSPYLTQLLGANSTVWMLASMDYIKTNLAGVFQEREQLGVKSVIDDNDNNVWKGRARFAGGFVDFRGYCAGGITGGTQLVS